MTLPREEMARTTYGAGLNEYRAFLRLLPVLKQTPQSAAWMTYDQEADVLCVHFRKPNVATDSELTDEDVIIRYAGDEVIGVTILHASER
jgi:uncharacterized protein YuzE